MTLFQNGFERYSLDVVPDPHDILSFIRSFSVSTIKDL